MKPLQAILFDLDGTLIDTAGDLIRSLNVLLETKGLATCTTEAMRPHAGQGSYSLIRAGFGNNLSEDEYRQLTSEFLEIYQTLMHDTTTLFPEASGTIARVKQRGMKWGIVTNKSERLTVPILQKMDLYDDADCLVYGDTTTEKKPHPKPLLYAAQQINLAPQHCAYLGDTLNDVNAALHAEMRALAVSYGYRAKEADIADWGAEAIFDTLSELCIWIDRLPIESSKQ
ncbi:MAG: HAD-IA family hydrolase [Chromatiales bacterium]|nr:HAD-IA family hydrolase [Chromatiales bacterium]